MIDERIAAGGTAADTSFADAELDAWFLVPSDSLEEAAWRGWLMKMGWALSEASGTLLEKSVGSERLKFASSDARSQFEHARAMADYYYALIPESEQEALATKSLVLSMHGEDVLGTKTICYEDLSRLLPESAGWC